MYSLSWYMHVVVDTVLQCIDLLEVVLHVKNSKVYLPHKTYFSLCTITCCMELNLMFEKKSIVSKKTLLPKSS